MYKLRLALSKSPVETQRHTTFGKAAEEFRRILGNELHLHVCYYCKFLVEYNEYGGTDYRHDQLYCLRDNSAYLDEIMQAYPRLRGHEPLLSYGTPEMDALHSCSAFAYRNLPRL